MINIYLQIRSLIIACIVLFGLGMLGFGGSYFLATSYVDEAIAQHNLALERAGFERVESDGSHIFNEMNIVYLVGALAGLGLGIPALIVAISNSMMVSKVCRAVFRANILNDAINLDTTGVMIVSAKTNKFVFANTAATNHFGYRRYNQIANYLKINDVFEIENLSYFLTDVIHHRKNGTEQVAVMARHADGSVHPACIIVHPVFDDHGNPEFYHIMVKCPESCAVHPADDVQPVPLPVYQSRMLKAA